MRKPRTKQVSIRNCEDGAAAIEFALVGLAFILLVTGVIEFGRALEQRNQIAHAVDMVARVMLINPKASDEQLIQVYQNNIRDAGLPTPEFGQSGSQRTVTVNYVYAPFVPGIGRFTMSISRTAPL